MPLYDYDFPGYNITTKSQEMDNVIDRRGKKNTKKKENIHHQMLLILIENIIIYYLRASEYRKGIEGHDK